MCWGVGKYMPIPSIMLSKYQSGQMLHKTDSGCWYSVLFFLPYLQGDSIKAKLLVWNLSFFDLICLCLQMRTLDSENIGTNQSQIRKLLHLLTVQGVLGFISNMLGTTLHHTEATDCCTIWKVW